METITIVNPEPQIKAWISSSEILFEHWQEVVRREDWGDQNKTREQAIALREFYEGQLTMALNFRDFISQKTINQK